MATRSRASARRRFLRGWRRTGRRSRTGCARRPNGQLRAGTLPAGVDLIIAAHSHDFIGRRTRLAARVGAIGYHPSLLPRHRGRDAVRWAIHMGEAVTGGSVYWLGDGVDSGPIAAQDWCWIRPGDTPGELWRRELFPLGVRLLRRAVADLARGVIVRIDQDPRLATFEPAFGRERLARPDLDALPAPGASESGLRVIRSRGLYEELYAPLYEGA